jgi:hypothetical protein
MVLSLSNVQLSFVNHTGLIQYHRCDAMPVIQVRFNNASAVKIYNAKSSLARLENKNIFF